MQRVNEVSVAFKDESEVRPEILEYVSFRVDQKLQTAERQYIRYSTKEFSTVCPYSGMPDRGTLLIQYFPRTKIVQLDSLHDYLLSYRSVGILQPAATDKVFEDLWTLLEPLALSVSTTYEGRGGIDSTCRIEKHMEGRQELLREFAR